MCSPATVLGAKAAISCKLVMNKAEVPAVWMESLVLEEGMDFKTGCAQKLVPGSAQVISHLDIIFCFIYCSTSVRKKGMESPGYRV